MIIESIVTTQARDGTVHIAPMGVIWRDETPVLAPFRPSTTLDNLAAHPFAVINHTDDVRIFAGCLTGRRDWPTRAAEKVLGHVLIDALSHQEVAVDRRDEDETRPRFSCHVVHAANHRAFAGFNRAQAAVIEAAILVSRLHILPADKVEREIAYLEIAIGKTAGPREHEAWLWLSERIAEFRREVAKA